MKETKTNQSAEDFASMLESSLAGMEKLRPGQLVESRVVSISNEYIFLQLSGKSEGVLERAEMTGSDGQLTVAEGDTVKAYFLQSKNGELLFTTRISGDKAGSAMLEHAWQNKIPVEGVVEKEIKGGFEVKIGDSKAFCPHSQMGLRRTDTGETWVGRHLGFQIQEYKDNGRRIVVSNRAIEEAAQQERLAALRATLTVGQTVRTVITSLQDFGAFVDLGGVQALLPVSEISRERVKDIRGVLSVGQEIEAEIIKIDWQAERISLSMKKLSTDPWQNAAEKYPVDSKHAGTVSRLADFGAFVTLEPGLDGLVHVSEFRSSGKYTNLRDFVKPGQALQVQILDVDPANRRIALKPAASVEEESAASKYIGGDSDTDAYNPFAALLKK